MSLNPDTKVLSYYDVLLRQSDLDLFTGPHWLNDQCIAFYFEYLIHEVYPKSADVLLVPGATSYLLATSKPTASAHQQSLPHKISPPRLTLLSNYRCRSS